MGHNKSETDIEKAIKVSFWIFTSIPKMYIFPFRIIAGAIFKEKFDDLIEYRFTDAASLKFKCFSVKVLTGLQAHFTYFYISLAALSTKNISDAINQLKIPIGWMIMLFISTILYSIAEITHSLLSTTDFEKKSKGRDAEEVIDEFIRKCLKEELGWSVRSNCLFVFNENTENEWSAEVDHIVVGRKAVYLVESKYKSGTIEADPDANQWRVTYHDKHSSMRNALKQSQNSARALKNQLCIPDVEFVPVVAFFGNQVNVIGPPNVVFYLNVTEAIMVHDESIQGAGIDRSMVLQVIDQCLSKDPEAMVRHIMRAKAKQALNQHLDTEDAPA